jgi:hypothetical protein
MKEMDKETKAKLKEWKAQLHLDKVAKRNRKKANKKKKEISRSDARELMDPAKHHRYKNRVKHKF